MRRLFLFLFVSVLAMVSAAPAQQVAGDWSGVLNAGGAQLHLNLHITKDAKGSLHGTLDSVDQGAMGIPIGTVTLVGAKLTLDIPAIRGTYDGTLSADGSALDGTWKQVQPLPLRFTRAAAKAAPKPAAPSTIDGTWLGTLDTGAIKLRVAFHIVNMSDGLHATMDSLDQNAKGIPVTSVDLSGSSLKMTVSAVGGTYQGTVSKDQQSIDGTWTQGGGSLPLVLKRVKDASQLERPRPQEPKPPLPYRSEEVSYENKAAAITLAATLTIPQGKGPFPAVVLLTGSGPQDRDEAIMGHKPFLVLSDYLTRRGIVVLRADDRGIGKSGGVFAKATTADFATDAEAGIAFLKSRPEVDVHKIGLVGHSEGAIEAAMVAARNPDVAFIVMMAGTAVPGDQIIVEQVRLIAEARGATPEHIQQAVEKERAVLDIVKTVKDETAMKQQLRAALTGTVADAALGAEVTQLTSPWFRYFIAYDPAIDLRKVKCPVLAIDGSKDLQVPPKQNLDGIHAALEQAGNKNVETVEFPGLNHLFQHAMTGSPTECAEIEETIAPEVLEKIAGWVAQR